MSYLFNIYSIRFYHCSKLSNSHYIAKDIYIIVFAMNSDKGINKMEDDNDRKRSVISTAENEIVITTNRETKKQKMESDSKKDTFVSDTNERQKFASAWKSLLMMNDSGKYYEPTEQQVQLIVDGSSIATVYKNFGNNTKGCIYCIEKTSNESCFFAIILEHMKNDAMEMQRQQHLTNIQVRKRLYENFAEEQYDYVHRMQNFTRMPCIPLPWCFEQGMKKAFPNEPGQACVGYKSSRACGKK